MEGWQVDGEFSHLTDFGLELVILSIIVDIGGSSGFSLMLMASEITLMLSIAFFVQL